MNKPTKKPKKSKQHYPKGWDAKRVRRVLEHYENQSEDEAVAEDEAAFEMEGQTVMIVPTKLVPKIRMHGSTAGRMTVQPCSSASEKTGSPQF